MDGDAALADMIARVRSLGGMPEDVARAAAPLVQEAARSTVRAGTTPTGKPWPRKKDGGQPLQNAAAALTAEPSGTTVTLVLTGPEVFHHYGVGKSTPRRQQIPDPGDPLPPRLAEALARGAEQVFRERTRAA